MGPAYLIRYGLARAVGRFATGPGPDPGPGPGPFQRGDAVVVRTHRGTELGEVLGDASASFAAPAGDAPILRAAAAADLDRARRAEADRPAHFEACRAVFEGGRWPLELIDAEPLLDEGRTVLHYLGPHRLDASGLVAAFRDRCGLDVVLEPAGRDAEEPAPEPKAGPDTSEAAAHGCGSCGTSGGGCGSGGCGSGGCGPDSGGCAVKAVVASRRKVVAEA